MYLCPTYFMAVALCVVTMFCWGSWANTQKLVNKKWRYELFYWDYVFGVLAASLFFAYTMGSHGALGRSFTADITQSTGEALLWAFAGGVVFNIANILLVAAIDIAGMSVAFPVGIGLATVLGVIWNYLGASGNSGNPTLLFAGVALLAIAIILSALSYRKRDQANADANAEKKPIGKGLFLALLCGVLMSLFYFFVAKSLAGVVIDGKVVPLTLSNLSQQGAGLQSGKLTPYSANVLFALGVLVSNCVIMPILMRKPFVGEPVEKGAYSKGARSDHFWGLVGGVIWAVGMTLNVIASGVASPAVAYGLGQGATLMSAIWGVFIWREFKGAPKGVNKILAAMFLFFVCGLALIIWTKLGDSADATPAAVVNDASVPEFTDLMGAKEDEQDAILVEPIEAEVEEEIVELTEPEEPTTEPAQDVATEPQDVTNEEPTAQEEAAPEPQPEPQPEATTEAAPVEDAPTSEAPDVDADAELLIEE